jgi:hypothetical protein
MSVQKQQKNNRQRIENFFQLGLLIFVMPLISMIGCNKLEENSGKLEVMGKFFLLNHLYITNVPSGCYNFFEFGSSEAKISVQFRLDNFCDWKIPTGTFKIGGSTNKPMLSSVHFQFVGDGIGGICEDEAMLRISKSGENLHFTLKGKMRSGENIYDFKLTYKM